MSSEHEKSLQNMPAVQDHAQQLVTLSEKVDRLTAKMDESMKKEVAVLKAKLKNLDRNSVARAENGLATETTTFAPLMNLTSSSRDRLVTAVHGLAPLACSEDFFRVPTTW
ncbi:hypothetical protein E4U09_003402 [Claviceps aff. purpurea]|uniref:Uncharacterized protein n=1 Tax=Claviceps aff. purpurea TaxID=1967640 RepID=A0A9P7U125_9HYPO|nr:hypothetical protein E4U09_003402 [Claviceps aff. purpurea]